MAIMQVTTSVEFMQVLRWYFVNFFYMEFFKKAKNEFGFNVWTVDGQICYYDEVVQKV